MSYVDEIHKMNYTVLKVEVETNRSACHNLDSLTIERVIFTVGVPWQLQSRTFTYENGAPYKVESPAEVVKRLHTDLLSLAETHDRKEQLDTKEKALMDDFYVALADFRKEKK